MHRLLIVGLAGSLLAVAGYGTTLGQGNPPSEKKGVEATPDVAKRAADLVRKLETTTNEDRRQQAIAELMLFVKENGRPATTAAGDALAAAIKENVNLAANSETKEQNSKRLERVTTLAAVVSRLAWELGVETPADPELALVKLLRESPNKHVREQAAESLEKMGGQAAAELAKGINQEFRLAEGSTSEEDKRRHLDRAKVIATVMGRIGTELSEKDYAVKEVIAAAGAKTTMETGDALREARLAAIEALGNIFGPSQDFQLRETIWENAAGAEELANVVQQAMIMEGDFAEKGPGFSTELAQEIEGMASELSVLVRVRALSRPSYRWLGYVYLQRSKDLKKKARNAQQIAEKWKQMGGEPEDLKEERKKAAGSLVKAARSLKRAAGKDNYGQVDLRKKEALKVLALALDDKEHFTIRLLAAETMSRLKTPPPRPPVDQR